MAQTYSVAVYLVDKAYGGPEEGGWWYNAGEAVRLIRTFKSETKASLFACRIQHLLDKTLNKGRREISSVLSTGRYYAEVHDGIPPQVYPEVTPRYE